MASAVGTLVYWAVESIFASELYATVAAVAAIWATSELTDSGGSMAAVQSGGLKLNTANTQEKVRVVYGRCKVGGNDVYRSTTGDDNNDLWIVQGLGEGEIAGIHQVDGVDQLFLDDKLYTEYGGKAAYWFYPGSGDQNYDPNLNAADPNWTDNQHYTANIVWKLVHDRDYFKSFPGKQAIVNGRLLYDFRTTLTAFSRNPVLALYDYLTNTRYGLGWDPAIIDIPSWTAAANYCDIKGFTLDLVVTGNDSAKTVINIMEQHFRGKIVPFADQLFLRYADLNYETPVMTITDEHIARDESGKAMISISQPKRFGKPDGLRVKYVDPDKNYAITDLIIGEENGVIGDYALPGCTDKQMAANLGSYALERQLLDRAARGTFRDDCLQLEGFDLVIVNSSALNISGQYMRVAQADILPSGQAGLALQYEDLTLYDDNYNIDLDNIYTTNLPDKNAPVPPVENAAVTEEVYDYRQRRFTRLKIDFNPPANYPWVRHVKVYRSEDGLNWRYLYPVETGFTVDPVEEGQSCYFKLQTVSIFDGATQDELCPVVSTTVAGHNSEPQSLSGLWPIINGSNLNLYGEKVTDADVELYEYRLGGTWNSAVFLAAMVAPNLSFYGVKPGGHSIWCNTLSNNGLYGLTPQSAIVDLPDPPAGWSLYASPLYNYATGTHNNTAQVTYNSLPHLQCSHTGGNLAGAYKSPVYDAGVSQRYMAFVDAPIVVVGQGTTWDDVVPDGTLWQAIGIDTKNWAAIFDLPAAPQVKIRLYYGDTNPPTNVVEKMELLTATVTARYFQTEIEITDPLPTINAYVEQHRIKLYV